MRGQKPRLMLTLALPAVVSNVAGRSSNYWDYFSSSDDIDMISPEDSHIKNRPYLIDSKEEYFPESLKTCCQGGTPFVKLFQLRQQAAAAAACAAAGDDGAPGVCSQGSPTSMGAQLKELGQQTRALLQGELHKHGVIVLRGLPLPRQDANSSDVLGTYSEFLHATGYKLTKYVGGVTARQESEPMVYPASDEDPAVSMDLHQDNTYWPVPPAKLLFYYERPASVGGLNPLLDMKEYATLAQARFPDIVAKFATLGVRYENYYPDASVDNRFVSWQASFESTDKEVVEANLKAGNFGFEWTPKRGLRKWNVLSPWKQHPVTGEQVWANMIVANHASYFHSHPSFPELNGIPFVVGQLPDALRSMEDYPFNIKYGDGTHVPYDVIQKLRGLAWDNAVAFKPRPGDLLVVDNYLAQHGRLGFAPPRRMWLGISLD